MLVKKLFSSIKMSFKVFEKDMLALKQPQPAFLIRDLNTGLKGIVIRQDAAKFNRMIDKVVIFWEDGDIGLLAAEDRIEILNMNLWRNSDDT